MSRCKRCDKEDSTVNPDLFGGLCADCVDAIITAWGDELVTIEHTEEGME